MAISKFAVACVAAILAGGATAGLASESFTPEQTQIASETPATPIAAIANPDAAFKDVAVRFTSGKAFGHVVGVATNARGRATKIQVALDDMPTTQLWIDQSDLVYSRAHDAIVAHDVHAPAMTVADAR
jgi:hypothetical protein